MKQFWRFVFRRQVCLLATLFLVTACEQEEKFPDIGTNVAGPIDVAASKDGQYFYVLNTDFERSYNQGSILVLKEDGTRVGATLLPRMGRSINVAGDRMIVTLDKGEESEEAAVHIYDLSNPESPTLARPPLPVECNPVNSALREGYDHFAVTCRGGKFYVGTFGANLADSTLNLVRNYESDRRAVYIDPARELMFVFASDLGPPNLDDLKATDEKTYSEEGEETEGANEVPDDFESTERMRKRPFNRYPYQFAVYDVKAERDQGFPYRELRKLDDHTADTELRWLYFTLTNFDGTPDSDEGIRNPGRKNYRTNIWEAQPNPLDSNSFFISQRGGEYSENANNIVKVSLIGSAATTAPDAEGHCVPGASRKEGGVCIPHTSTFMEFERVYGFHGEVDKLHYPGDFDVQLVRGQPLLLVNNFRDLANWGDDYRFSLAAKVLGDNTFWFDETLISDSHHLSYYQVAMNPRGRAITCSFYGNSVLLLDVVPGTDITVKAHID